MNPLGYENTDVKSVLHTKDGETIVEFWGGEDIPEEDLEGEWLASYEDWLGTSEMIIRDIGRAIDREDGAPVEGSMLGVHSGIIAGLKLALEIAERRAYGRHNNR